MLRELLTAWCLVAITVVIHAAGLVLLLRPAMQHAVRRDLRFWPTTRILIQLAWLLVVLHMLEVNVWACFYWWQDCLPDFETSVYFAGVTYTTLGYGDVVLPHDSRLYGPIEALTGILMCGLSTGFFFAVLTRLYVANRPRQRSETT